MVERKVCFLSKVNNWREERVDVSPRANISSTGNQCGKTFYRRKEWAPCRTSTVSSNSYLQIGHRWSDHIILVILGSVNIQFWGFPGGSSGKEPINQCRRNMRLRFDPWVGTIPWRRKQQPTPLFLPGESHVPKKLSGLPIIGLQRVGHD